MPIYPRLRAQLTQQELIDGFGGYDHRPRIPDGCWFDTKNLSSDHAPMLASRAPRGNTHIRAAALAEKDALAYVSEDGTLYYNFLPTALTGLLPGEKQMVSMGAYLVIFPDKVYFNTEDQTDRGSLEALVAETGAVYQPVRFDGTAADADYVQAQAPAEPTNGQYWIDTSGPTHALRQWSAAQNDWIAVETAYIKIRFPTLGVIPAHFRAKDGVTISGSSVEGVNGEKILLAVGGGEQENDWILISGLLERSVTDGGLTVARSVPKLDYVCECRNRLWGCYYGTDGGRTVNEIFCSALGDFRNWRRYEGAATDSWTGSVGSDGQWTGAVSYLGCPTFFKENRIHRVNVSSDGAHVIGETVCRGVQKGSARSLCVVNETLYYKSRSDVCAWQGGFPRGISAAFGDRRYSAAVAGAAGGKYYLSALDEDGAPSLFVYDIAKDIWMREDELRVTDFARVDGELYALAGGELLTLLGSLPVAGATGEGRVDWEAVTGVETLAVPENKRVSRYQIRLRMAPGASFAVFVQYDSDGVWRSAGSIAATGAETGSFLFPVRPRRCDHLQLKLAGSGDVRLFSIARILEVGSDYR